VVLSLPYERQRSDLVTFGYVSPTKLRVCNLNNSPQQRRRYYLPQQRSACFEVRCPVIKLSQTERLQDLLNLVRKGLCPNVVVSQAHEVCDVFHFRPGMIHLRVEVLVARLEMEGVLEAR